MKKLLLFVVLSITPILANAGSTAMAQLSNFTFTYTNTAPTFDLNSFSAFSVADANTAYTNDITSGLPPNYSFNLSASAFDGSSYSYSDATYSQDDSLSSMVSSVGTDNGTANSYNQAGINIFYKGGSLLSIFANASIFGSVTGPDTQATSFASLRLGAIGGDTGFYAQSYVNSYSNEGSYNIDDTLYLSFFSTHDQFLHLEVVTSASSVITPVPEPETYAMLLAGLGLIGFVSRRKS